MFIVYGSEGECSDWTCWPVRCFERREDAGAFATRLQADAEAWIGQFDGEFDRYWDAWGENIWDEKIPPPLEMDPTWRAKHNQAPNYEVIEVSGEMDAPGAWGVFK